MEAGAWQHMVTLFKHSKYAEELLVLGLWNWQSVCMLVMLCQAESFVETIPGTMTLCCQRNYQAFCRVA